MTPGQYTDPTSHKIYQVNNCIANTNCTPKGQYAELTKPAHKVNLEVLYKSNSYFLDQGFNHVNLHRDNFLQ